MARERHGKRKPNGNATANIAEYHRFSERRRHSALTEALTKLADSVPGRDVKETQIGTIDRAIRYSLFINNILKAVQHAMGQAMDLGALYKNAQDVQSQEKLIKLVRGSAGDQ